MSSSIGYYIVPILFSLVGMVLWIVVAAAAIWYWSKKRSLGVMLQAIGSGVMVLNGLGWVVYQAIMWASPVGFTESLSIALRFVGFAGLVCFVAGYAMERFTTANAREKQGFPVTRT